MDQTRWKTIEAIFHSVRQAPPDNWPDLLEESCGGDDEVKQGVQSLLDAQDEVGDFMFTPPLSGGAAPDTASTMFDLEDRSFIGKTMGPYRLDEVIASGGMGTVYLATRTDDSYQKRVAVKLLHSGLQSREVVRRFFRERQILANLDHPNIARLLDGGASEEGRPYLVMEYIEGETLDKYCDAKKLSVSARLDLFRRICSAVQYAHNKLVVHRDIKPGNILVTRDGVPKLLDFGIVKILDPEEAAMGTLTLTVERLMTPDYASPEQVRGEAISIATDIYSLGIVLYELLTGHRPFRFVTTSLKEMERIVCEIDPPRPSTAVEQSVEIPTSNGDTKSLTPEDVSKTREGRPEKLKRRLAGDLDHIVMKALRKEPESRYRSAEHLSEDLRRHLQGLPVHARKGTLRYRAGKFIRRNRAAAVVGVVILLLIAAGFYFAVQDARRAADQEAAQQVLDFLAQLNETPLISNRTPRKEIRQALETRGAVALADNLRDQPEELIRYAESIVPVCERFHHHDLAVYWRGIALQTREAILDPDHPDLAESCLRYGIALHRAGRFKEAEAHVRRAIDLETRTSREPGEATHRLAMILWDQADYEAAAQLFEESIGLLQADPLIEAMVDYADFLGERGDAERAAALLDRALAEARKLPDDRGELALARVYHSLGNLLWYTPRFSESEIYLRQAMEIYLRYYSREGDPRLFACMNDLSHRLIPNNSMLLSSEVHAIYWRTAWKERKKLFGEESIEAASSLYTMAPGLTIGSGNRLFNKALESYRGFWTEDHPKFTAVLFDKAVCIVRPAIPTMDDSDLEKGADLLSRALARLSDQLPSNHWRIGKAKVYLGMIRLKQGRKQEGRALVTEGLRIIKENFGEHHPEATGFLYALSRIYAVLGLSDEAADYKARFEEKKRTWPFNPSLKDCDLSREEQSQVNFEDDQIEKILVADRRLQDASRAYLWIFSKAESWAWRDFEVSEDCCIRVNHDPGQEIVFDVPLKCAYISEAFQWIPFEIPVAWLKPGPNTFTIYKLHDKDYAVSFSWERNQFVVGLDLDHDEDRSWCFGTGVGYKCCTAFGEAAMKHPKPLSRDDPLIMEHREQGYKEYKGELMMILELLE